jgi:hypothetical protein
MAFIQNTITDLDDLLIQITNITASGGNITVDTSAAHGITATAGRKVVISNTTNFNGEYEIASVTDTDTFVLTASGITATETSGQAMVNDVANSNTYYTPEITINISTSKFTLNAAGNLATAGSGVTGQALYSFFKERWKQVPSITKYEFPMLSITNEQFEFINGWEPADDATRKNIRTAGWSETDGTLVKRRYSGIISLGTLLNTDQPYYTQNSSFVADTINTTYEGPINEAVKIYSYVQGTDIVLSNTNDKITSTTSDLSRFAVGDQITISSTGGNNNVVVTVTAVNSATDIDVTGLTADESSGSAVTLVADQRNYFKLYVRTRGRTYTDADLTDIGVTQMTYIVYRFPLANATDLNIRTTNDAAFVGVNISSLIGDGTTITVDTTGTHGLYAGAPITLSNTGDITAGNYVVSAVTSATQFTIAGTFNGTETIGGTEAVKLRYIDTIDVEYLVGNVIGTATTIATYNLNDVVQDQTGRWFIANTSSVTLSAGEVADLTTTSTFDAYLGEREIETGQYSAYTIIVDLNNAGTTPGATKEIAYEWAQWKLRDIDTIDIDASRNGNIADTLVYFIGSQLHTYADINIPSAVAIDDIAEIDFNNITFHDYADATHLYPLVVLVTINFNDNLFNDTDAKFYAYYTLTASSQFGTTSALQVKKSNSVDVGAEISNNVPNDGIYQFNYAYDGDTTGGRVQSEDVGITVVAIGLDTGQYVSASGTIRNSGATISLVAPLERNYSDPNG